MNNLRKAFKLQLQQAINTIIAKNIAPAEEQEKLERELDWIVVDLTITISDIARYALEDQ